MSANCTILSVCSLDPRELTDFVTSIFRDCVFVCCMVRAQRIFLPEGTFCDCDICGLFYLLAILSASCRVHSVSWIHRALVFACCIVCTQQNYVQMSDSVKSILLKSIPQGCGTCLLCSLERAKMISRDTVSD